MDTIIQVDPNNTSMEVVEENVPVTVIYIKEENNKKYRWNDLSNEWEEIQ